MPSLEFAPYNKIPSGRARHDGRQGTIDQDPEFIDFLQSLTEPITKAAANGEDEAKHEKVTTTPLVQYIKEKKANKAKEKEVAAAKAGKKADVKDTKTVTPSKSDQQPVVKKTTTSEAEKARVAKATQDVVKAINTLSKSAAAQQSKSTPTKQEVPVKEPTTPTTAQPTPKRERQRGDANAAARIISRDLGLTPKEGRSAKGSRSAVTTPASAPSTPTTSTPTTSKAATAPTPASSASQPPPQPPTGPRNHRNSTPQPSPLRPSPAPPVQQPTPKSNTKPPPQPSSGAKSAFLKHANPSQGITEDLLRTTFSIYGTITRCEIDKKKGLGYLDFAEPEALKKAMAASPVKIANGSVVVLENRSPYRKTGSGSQSAVQTKGGATTAASTSTSVASSPKVTQAAMASISEATAIPAKAAEPATKEALASTKPPPPPIETVPASSEASEVLSTPVSPTVTTTPGQSQTPPSAPRGGAGGRGGRGHHRGRGGFRGRGGHRGGNRAASAAAGNGSGTGAPSTPAASASDNKG